MRRHIHSPRYVYVAAAYENRSGHLHPLKYALGLARNCMLTEFGPRVASEIAPRIMPVGTYTVSTGQVFPDLRRVPIEHVWGGFVDISMNRAPDFGRPGDNLYYLQGFSGHGVALTGLAGQLVADAVTGQAGRFDVFARLRHHRFPGGALLRTPSLALGMWWHRMRDVIG